MTAPPTTPIVPIGAKIPAAWAWHRLDSICEGIVDCPHSTPVLTNTGPFVVRTQDIRTGILRTDQAARVSEQTYRERIARAEPRTGDLLFSREGTYFGHAAEVPDGVRVCLGQRMVLIRPNSRTIDSTFLRFWINSPFMAGHIAGLRDGSVAERLNLPTIRSLPVGVPPLPEQRKIARILGALDDKIELNRKMNATLEAMARALFKSWFVDFAPVRAKAQGRPPSGMDAETAKLFPSEFVESELGPIPKGWNATTVGELLSLEYGKALKEAERQPGPVLVFGSNGIVGRHSEALVRGAGIVVGRKGNPGIVTWAPSDFFVIDTAFYVAPKDARTSLRFLRHLLEALGLARLSADSAVPGVNRNAIYAQLVASPPSDVLARFQDLAETWGLTSSALDQQSVTLARLRDELLTRLFSGELSVDRAELISGDGNGPL